MKRIVSLVLALSMVLSMFTMSFAGLKDVDGTKYEAAVEALIELGVVNGYPDGTYLPENVVTRAELAKLLVTAYGLEAAAEASKGATPFSDIAENHWGAGYINVAADYGFVNGYPDGTFKGDATVTYAEAITMCLRVLGYAREVESVGTWPTNYISKAQDLKLMRDISYGSYNDGAKRGNVALLIWNMLRTEMWEVTSESEGDGLHSEPNRYMLNVKFSDYSYQEDATFVSYNVKGTEVTVTVKDSDDARVVGTVEGIDLLRLVPDMKVDYLYNEEDEKFMTLACADEMVEGRIDLKGKLDGVEYEGLDEDPYTYVVAIVDGDEVENYIVLPDGGTEINEIDANTLKRAKNTIDKKTLVIIDGEWANGEALEEGDVYTKFTGHGDAFYVVSRNRVEGEFKSLSTSSDKDNYRAYMKVDSEEVESYIEEAIKVYVYDEDEEEYVDDILALSDLDDKDCEYLGEDVEIATDYLGNAINIYFNEVEEEAGDESFYILTGKNVWFDSTEDGMKFYARATDVNGDETTYEIKTDDPEFMGMFLEGSAIDIHDMLSVMYNEAPAEIRDEVLADMLLEFVFIGKYDDDDEVLTVYPDFDDSEDYEVAEFDQEIDEDGYYDTFKVTADTKVLKIVPTLEKDGNEYKIKSIKVEVYEGADELDGVEYGKYAYEIDEDGDPVDNEIAYVIVSEDAKSDDLHFGLLEARNRDEGITYLTISGKQYLLAEDAEEYSASFGDFVAFTENDDEIEIVDSVTVNDLDEAGIVSEATNGGITIEGLADALTALAGSEAVAELKMSGDKIDPGRKAVKEFFEDVQFVIGYVSVDEDDNLVFESDVEDAVEGIEGVTFEKGDRIIPNDDYTVVAIIRGLAKDDVIEDGKLVDEYVEEPVIEDVTITVVQDTNGVETTYGEMTVESVDGVVTLNIEDAPTCVLDPDWVPDEAQFPITCAAGETVTIYYVEGN